MGTPTLNDHLPASAKDLEKISTIKRYEQKSQIDLRFERTVLEVLNQN